MLSRDKLERIMELLVKMSIQLKEVILMLESTMKRNKHRD